mmetsp:Transcript_116373/g.336126  ORF Transcript_116373/g.336126 Transcript_116373/m.336126 type:complete len:404 (+) Transcript_116373:133-1344(+)
MRPARHASGHYRQARRRQAPWQACSELDDDEVPQQQAMWKACADADWGEWGVPGDWGLEFWDEDQEGAASWRACASWDVCNSSLWLSWGSWIPRVDLFGQDQGQLLAALSACGVAFVDLPTKSSGWRQPRWMKWKDLMNEACYNRGYFQKRQCIEQRHLRFSWSEDLKRTIEHDKAFVPDDRCMFGMSDGVLRAKRVDWDDLAWVVEEYRALKLPTVALFENELRPLCTQEADSSGLGAKILSGREKWSGSALRHCFYWDGGSCTDHTDYGILTIQNSTHSGLEANFNGEWVSIEPPPGCLVILAGDMMERLTNGHIKACLHRVRIDKASEPRKAGTTRRQSHIMFLQPDTDTVIAPLPQFLSEAGGNLDPIRYGDWHKMKVNLAFGDRIAMRGRRIGQAKKR